MRYINEMLLEFFWEYLGEFGFSKFFRNFRRCWHPECVKLIEFM